MLLSVFRHAHGVVILFKVSGSFDMKKIAILMLSSLLLTACSYYPYHGKYNEDYASHGHATTHVSATVRDPNLKPLSYYLNNRDNSIAGQEAALRRAIHGSGVEVKRMGNTLLLNFARPGMFASGSSRVNKTFLPILDNVARVFAHYPSTMLEILGHTDSVGKETYNTTLSQRRADAVKKLLKARNVPQTITTTAMGEKSPAANNSNASGRAQNRRVEIKVAPSGG